jgi:hypothetical protein
MPKHPSHYYVYVNGARVLETRSRARAERAVRELRDMRIKGEAELPGAYRVYMTDHIGKAGDNA